MRQEVEEGKDDRTRLLNPQDAVERPFAMVLDHRTKHWRIPRDSLIGYDMLTDVVAIGGTCPEEQAEVDG